MEMSEERVHENENRWIEIFSVKNTGKKTENKHEPQKFVGQHQNI